MKGAQFHRHGLGGSFRRFFPHLDRRACGRFVRYHRVAGVGLVVHQHFPVAVVHVAQHAAFDLQFAFGRAIHHVIQRGQRFAEKILKTLPLRVQAAEDEIAVVFHRAHLCHAAAGFILRELFRRIAALERQRKNAAVQLEVPGVIRAAQKAACVAAGLVEHHHPLVRAAVVQHANRAVRLADHHHRLIADGGGEKIPGLRDLAGVAHVNPGVGEQVFHFKLEDFFVNEQVTVNLRGANQIADRLRIVAVATLAVGLHDGLSSNFFRPQPRVVVIAVACAARRSNVHPVFHPWHPSARHQSTA